MSNSFPLALNNQSTKENEAQTLLQGLQQARKDAALVSWVQQQYNLAKTERLSTERQWFINLAFYFGRQNVQFIQAGNTFQLRTPKAPPWRVRMIVNKIRPMVRHEIAKLTSHRPTFEVIPATTEDEDQVAARVGTQIFEAAYAEKKLGKVIRQACWWASITGTGFIKQYWDSRAVVSDDPKNPIIGDIVVERISPFHIYVPNLDEEDLDKQPYLFHVTTKSPEWVKTVYGLEQVSTVNAESPIELSFKQMVGARFNPKREVVCIEVWIKPGGHPDFPRGGMLTVIGNKLVQKVNEFPYVTKEYPFVKIEVVPTGKFYGESNVTDLIPLQRELNRTKSQIIEAKNIMAKPRLIAPRGSVNPRQITSEPGQVILYTPGFAPPQPLPIDNLPPYVLQELDRLQMEMDDISGQHEISRGSTPSQVTAATAISYLQEQDDTKLAYALASIESAVQELGVQYLKFVNQYWDTPRLIKVVGRDGAFEANHWNKNAIKGNTDLRVQSGSALPQSKAARQAFVMDLLKLGLIPPEQGLDMLDIGGIEKIYEDYLVDKRQAERENLKIASLDEILAVMLTMPQVDPMTGEAALDPETGGPIMPPPAIPANTWDNHQAHIMIHNRFRKTQQFELLSDAHKQLFEQHVLLHQMALAGVMPQLPGGNVGPPMEPGGTVVPDQGGGMPQQQEQPGQEPPPPPQS